MSVTGLSGSVRCGEPNGKTQCSGGGSPKRSTNHAETAAEERPGTTFDEWIKGFLRCRADGTVAEIGAGLNTRLERLDNGRLHWFDLDLPDAVELRRLFFTDNERRTTASSVLESGWTATMRQSPGPYFFVAEEVFVYLERARGQGGAGTDHGQLPVRQDCLRHSQS
jgi:O-methyltransferase involved in polyketide biosynthesis